MINNSIKRDKKLEQLLEITNISDKKLAKLNWKEKQKYYRAKTKVCRVFFNSTDKNGKGITYVRPKLDKQVK